jgi:hypothetical protein
MALVLSSLVGCLDGPLFALKRMNPVYRREWAKDSKLGPTYYERIEELRSLRTQIGSMPSEEQSTWMVHLDAIIEHDPSPEMRREAVLALGNVSSAESVTLLRKAVDDDSDKVRMAVCQSIANQDAASALPIIQKLLKDENVDGVQTEAVRALGSFNTTESKGMLAAVLQEKSPAMQYVATEALAQSTGMNYGGNVSKWKAYLNGEVTEDEPMSMAEKATQWIPFR